MSLHYFIGIRIPPAAAGKLANSRDSWGLATHKRSTPPADMHITLLFIGEDRFGELAEIKSRLEHIALPPFRLKTNGVEKFGNPETPRIVYAALKESGELMALQRAVKSQMEGLELKTDPKPFVPHITLSSRWRGGAFPDMLDLEKVEFNVDAFSLFEIRPREIPRYREIHTYPLANGTSSTGSER